MGNEYGEFVKPSYWPYSHLMAINLSAKAVTCLLATLAQALIALSTGLFLSYFRFSFFYLAWAQLGVDCASACLVWAQPVLV